MMKRAAVLLVFLCLMTLPQIVSATWWNPLTWFVKSPSSVTVIKSSVSTVVATSTGSSQISEVQEVDEDRLQTIQDPQPATVIKVSNLSTFDTPLTLGMSGEQIFQLQKFLLSQGCSQGSVNGTFDRFTTRNVKCFQMKYNLLETGSFDLATAAIANNLIQEVVLPLANRNDQTAIQERALAARIDDLQQKLVKLNERYSQSCQNQNDQNVDVVGVAAAIIRLSAENCTYMLSVATLLEQEIRYSQNNPTAQDTLQLQIFNLEQRIFDVKHEAFQQINAIYSEPNYTLDTMVGRVNRVNDVANNEITQLQYQIQTLQQRLQY